jgi:hypothetical protein
MLVNAFNEWTDATEGKLSWVEVHNKPDAEIVCQWQGEPKNSLFEDGAAVVNSHPPVKHTKIIETANITICTMTQSPLGFGYVPMSDAHVNCACLHEVGHALGLGGHSSNKNDVMYFARSGQDNCHLSARDKTTIARLYKSAK